MVATLNSNLSLSPALKVAVTITALIDLVIGLLFLFAPEIKFVLWPSAIAPLLARFIGAIVIANGIAAWFVAQQGTWENARTLFLVALVYGAIVLVALLYHLLFKSAPSVFWFYLLVDALFLGPILYIFLNYERARAR